MRKGNENKKGRKPIVPIQQHEVEHVTSKEVHQQSHFQRSRDCDDCLNDCYDEMHNEYLLFLFMRIFTPRISKIESIQQCEHEKNKIRESSDQYSFKRCQFGSYHLWRGGKRVLMCKEAYRMVHEIHGAEHRKPMLMKVRIQTEKDVDYQSIEQFVQEFPLHCDSCSIGANNGQSKLSPIWKYVDSQAKIKKFPQILEQLRGSNNFNAFDCLSDRCKSDAYDQQFEDVRYCFLHRDFPPQIQHQTYSMYKNRIGRILEKVKKVDIRECSKGTYHLWTHCQKVRVPMENEKIIIAHQLHGDEHRDEQSMMDLLLEKKVICPNRMWGAIKKTVQNCTQCKINPNRKKTYQNSPLKVQSLTNSIYQQKRKASPSNSQLQSPSQLYDRISAFIHQFPLDHDLDLYASSIQQKFNISNALMNFVKNEMFWVHRSEEEVFDFLESKGVKVRTVSQKMNGFTIYKAILFYTSEMKSNYGRFGDCLCIDYVKQAIKKRTATGQHYQTGFLTGQNERLQTVLFGIVLIDQEAAENHKKIYEIFFNEMGDSHFPRSIVSSKNIQSQHALNLIFKQKNLKISLLTNWFSQIQFLKQRIRFQSNRQKLLQLFCEALKQTDQKVYTEIMRNLNSVLVDRRTLSDFENQSYKYCLLHTKNEYIGFAMSTDRTIQLFNQISNNFVYAKQIGNVVIFMLQLQKSLSNLQTEDFAYQLNQMHQEQKNGIFRQLQILKQKYSNRIYQQLLKNYKKAFLITLLQKSSCQLAAMEKGEKCVHVLKYSVASDHWVCSCRYLFWTGLPCSHLVAVLMKHSGSLEYYISSRWKITNKASIIKPKIEGKDMKRCENSRELFTFPYRCNIYNMGKRPASKQNP